jgi:non-specific serine/threonine protein kinase
MTKSTASVRDGVLTYRDGGEDRSIAVGSAVWEGWLDQPGTTAFRFESGAGHFSARRESQRGGHYWYAYRRQHGRLRKAYLGRSRGLTLERLEAAACRTSAPLGGETRESVASAVGPSAGRAHHNLPSEISSFFSRQVEIADVRRALAASRLVTLTGAGGIGKTRLALRVAAGLLEDEADAVWLVELAALSDPALVPQAIAQAVGLRDVPGQPLLATLTAGLGIGRTLLLLDNCEHLIEACALVATHLLRTCSDLRVLATSREPLGAAGERTCRVPSLGLPPPGETTDREGLARSAAVQLFVARAQATRPDFVLTVEHAPSVAEVCRQLDGIPLAIELAAARMRVLAPGELAARLDDRLRLLAGGDRGGPSRHRTLRAAIDWSYDLLTEPERRCFEQLSVFAGGFSLEAAEAVSADGETEAVPVLDLLARLVDRSLVVAEPPDGTEPTRYRLLETLRLYAAERLAMRGGTEAARASHAAWVTARAEQAVAAYHGPDQGRWLRWAERECDNARAALAWALARGEADVAVRLAAALSWPWLVHQRWSEGLDWARRVLALPASKPTRQRGWLLVGAIQFMAFRGDLASNRPGGDLQEAQRLNEECLAIGSALADGELLLAGRGIAQLLTEFGIGVGGVAEQPEEDLLAEARRIGMRWGERRALEALARRALRRDDLSAAGTHLRDAVESARQDGDGWSLAIALNALGDVERAGGTARRARPHYEESMAVFADLGLGEQPSLAHNLGYVEFAAGDPARAAAHFRQALGQFCRLGERRGMAECLIGLGVVAVAERQLEDAGRLVGAGEAALAALGMRLWPPNRLEVDRSLARAKSSRSGGVFAAARAEGCVLPLERAVASALAEPRADAPPARPGASGHWLTPREREVAQLAAQGLTNREIGVALGVAVKTAANHLQRVLEKLDLRTRTQLAAHADALGLFALDSSSSRPAGTNPRDTSRPRTDHA